MKRVLILANHEYTIYNFRLELIERLIEEGHEVIISCPKGEKVDILISMGCKFEDIQIQRHGKNPFGDLFLLNNYKKLFKKIKPDIVFSYTIKPNIYGSIVCRWQKIPIIPNITGLGSAVERKSMLQRFIIQLYRYSFKDIDTVFFQNEENKKFFKINKIQIKNSVLIPGSGINLNKFELMDYPNSDVIKFVFVSRIMKEKGIDLYLELAKNIKQKYPNTEFHICGFCEEEYEGIIKKYEEANIVYYHGMIEDIRNILRETHCTIHPSYYPEGMSNILLESSACGRPVITTNRSGCREVVNQNLSGYLVPINNYEKLEDAVVDFLGLSQNEKKEMGIEGRKFIEKQFDRNIVIEKYISEIEKKERSIL